MVSGFVKCANGALTYHIPSAGFDVAAAARQLPEGEVKQGLGRIRKVEY